MTWRRDRMLEDRHLRNAARALVDADLKNLRADLSAKGIGERALDRITTGANDIYEEAVDVAADHKGALAAILAAVILWLARNPIREMVTGERANEDADER